MYFDEPAEVFDRSMEKPMAAVMLATGLFTVLFVAYPAPITEAAADAAAVLFPMDGTSVAVVR